MFRMKVMYFWVILWVVVPGSLPCSDALLLASVNLFLSLSLFFFFKNSDKPKEKPPNFRQYLEAMIAFSKHESLVCLFANSFRYMI